MGSSTSSSRTSRSRNVWNGEYHSRSQCVGGTMATRVGMISTLVGSGGALLARDPAVADPGFGQDEPRVGGVVAELLAELADVHAQVIALAAVALTPDLA